MILRHDYSDSIVQKTTSFVCRYLPELEKEVMKADKKMKETRKERMDERKKDRMTERDRVRKKRKKERKKDWISERDTIRKRRKERK